jgi:adenylate cyclase
MGHFDDLDLARVMTIRPTRRSGTRRKCSNMTGRSSSTSATSSCSPSAVQRMRCDSPPRSTSRHAATHAGPAIYRGGDYIGTTVNIAARVADVAAAGETLVTEAVARETADGAALEPVGVRMLRGAAQPLQLYRLARKEQQRDPVCGAIVDAPPAASLREGDTELWFCSQSCLRGYLTEHQVMA